MESIEYKRYTKYLLFLLLKIFNESIEDPLFRRLTINHLSMNRNRTIAFVYLDLKSTENPRKVLSKLNRLNGLFRSLMKPHINKYRIPYLKFIEDKVLEKGMRVEELIEKDINNAKGS